MSKLKPSAAPLPLARKAGYLRATIWLLPAVVVPMCLFGLQLLNLSPFSGGVIGLGLTIYLGHFDALFWCQQRGIPQDHPRARIGKRVLEFVIVQIALIPALWVILLLVLFVMNGCHLGLQC